jgi:hypothetical protein
MHVALKRKHTYCGLDDDVTTNDRGTLARPALTNALEKRLFRSGPKRPKTVVSVQEDDMSELVQFILAHEEAFQRSVAMCATCFHHLSRAAN